MNYNAESFGISDIGLVRENNEDHWAMLATPPFFALADGMGGHNAGEIAAKEAVQTLCQKIYEHFENAPADIYSLQEIKSHLKKTIINTNNWIYRLASENKNLQGMGTTLCCMLLFQHYLLYANVGDSRAYRYRDKLEQLTVDHSLRQELVDKGELEQKHFHTFPQKNIITRAIGKQSDVEPDIGVIQVQVGDIYFLCSDGLSDYVSNSEISDIIKANGSLEKISKSLVEIAKDKGGNDNISIVIIKILP